MRGAPEQELAREGLIDVFLEAAGEQLAADGVIVVAVAPATAVEFQQHAAQRWEAQGLRRAVQDLGFKAFHAANRRRVASFWPRLSG